MKYSFTLVLLLMSYYSFAQKIKVTDSDERIGGGKNPALVVSIYDATLDDVRS